ncbi:MAG: UDP-glucose/GDP-mannose dehydrogenase family protein, partial [Pseudomonadota bacterium]
MNVTVFGTGYVGLVQGAALAEVGNRVCCIDVDPDKVDALSNGEVPIFEPGLEKMVRDNLEAGRLWFSTDASAGIAHGAAIFIAVGTPSDADGAADISAVKAVAQSIGAHMDGPKLIINKSTVPVGTEALVRSLISERLAERGAAHDFDVVSAPEFLKEGSAVADCMRPDRIVLGVRRADSTATLRELFAPFNRNHEKLILMDPRSAELTKYAANCMLATKISFMNEVASLADRLGADIEAVRRGIGSDPRIGYHFIYAGAGYGGSCFPKDVAALIHTAEDAGCDPVILRAVEARNEAAQGVMFDKISAHFGDLSGKVIALWGLAYKPNTDDMRNAPSRRLMEALWDAGAQVQAYDPVAMETCQSHYGPRHDLRLCGTKEAALDGADALALMTEWRAFQSPDYAALRARLTSPVVFDGRNIYDPRRMRE